jgi:hypothetical protein
MVVEDRQRGNHIICLSEKAKQLHPLTVEEYSKGGWASIDHPPSLLESLWS